MNLYTIIGRHDFIDEDGFPRLNKPSPYVMAQSFKSVYEIQTTYEGLIMNPSDPYYERPRLISGRPNWRYKKVTKEQFDNYLEYLKTKNMLCLNKVGKLWN